MKLIVSVVRRGAPRGEDGCVHIVDWERKSVLRTFEPPSALIEHFPESGGAGVRGYRGICFAGDLCYIASADTLYGYDASWSLQRQISHPLFSDVHEIAWDGASFWVTSTGVDGVLRLDAEGELLDAYLLGELPAEFRGLAGIAERSIDRAIDHRRTTYRMRESHVAHPNAIQIVEGRPYVTLYFQGAVIALEPPELIWRDRSYYGAHSGRLLDGKLYLAASFQQALLVTEPGNGAGTEISVLDESFGDSRGTAKKVLQSAAITLDSRGLVPRTLLNRIPERFNPRPQRDRPGWARGIYVLDERHVLIGSSPASIALIDTQSRRVIDRMVLSDELAQSVFAIEVDRRES